METDRMKLPETIVELYDDEQIYNVLAATEFKPKNVVFIGTRKLKSKRIKNAIISCLRMLGLNTKCFFYSTDMLNIDSIISELNHILELFGEVVIDLTGGSEVALVAVGMIAREKNIPLMRYDRYDYGYRNIYNCPVAETIKSDPHFTVPAFLALAGGIMKEHGHLSLDRLDDDSAADIFKVWEIFKKRYRTWHRIVSYLQQVTKKHPDDLKQNEALEVDAPGVVYSGEQLVNCDTQIMEELAAAGIILDYRFDGRRVSFVYKSKLMRSCLIDTGICLELYVYATAAQSGSYDDVQISVVVDWDGDLSQRINTVNEIDIMLAKGQVPVFISCKSGSPNVVALNEIKTLATKFGGENGRPVLVTMADVRSRDAYLYQRAADMGVTVVDYYDLVNDKLAKRLLSVSKL